MKPVKNKPQEIILGSLFGMVFMIGTFLMESSMSGRDGYYSPVMYCVYGYLAIMPVLTALYLIDNYFIGRKLAKESNNVAP